MSVQARSRTGRVALVAGMVLLVQATSALAVVYPVQPTVYFQTNGRTRAPTVGDWYTTTASASTDPIHRLLIEITPEQLVACGGVCDVIVLDAESTAGAAIPQDEVFGANDPTQFSLRDRTGVTILQGPVTVAGGSADGTNVTFTVNAPGVYQLTSVTGAFPISGNPAAGLNDDDNGWRVDVEQATGATGGHVGFLQTTSAHGSAGTITLPLFFVAGPTAADVTLALRNFDLDLGTVTVTYDDPPVGGPVAGTVSNNGIWNGVAGTLNTGQDNVAADTAFPGGTDIGSWSLTATGFTANNQAIYEANDGGQRLPLLGAAPVRAGHFAFGAGGAACSNNTQPAARTFTITNHYFTNDIVNFTVSAAPAGWTAGQLQTSGGAPLTDSDGNGQVDTGIMTPGQTLTLRIQTTPTGADLAPYVATVSGVSLLDARVGAANTTRTVVEEFYVCAEVAKAFAPASVAINQPSTLTFTLTNRNTSPFSALNFTDTYPAGLVNATPLTVGGTCAGVTTTATAGGGTFNVTAGTVPAAVAGGPSGSCTITVLVRSAAVGAYANQTSGASGVVLGDAIGTGAASNTATLNVLTATLLVVKSSAAFSDPFNAQTNPKRIPGGFVSYGIIVTNPDPVGVDLNSVFIVDPIPAATDLFVGDVSGPGSGPVAFTDGAPSSGLTYTFVSLASGADDLSFSNDGGATFAYVPVPNASGVDPAVTHVRINPKGSLAGDVVPGAPSPGFTVSFRVRLE